MLSIVSKTRYALKENGELITEYEWNNAQEVRGYIFLYNDNTLVIYDKSTGVKTLQVDQMEDFKSTDTHLLIKQAGNWGMFEFTGKCIIPCEYDYIGKAIYSQTTHELIAVDVDTDFETGGYYIVSENKYYPADDISITKTNKIELLVNGQWEMIN